MSQALSSARHPAALFRPSNDLFLIFSLALIARLLLAAFTYNAPLIEDLQRYRQVGATVIAGGSAYDLDIAAYPYAPPWMFIEAGAVWISRRVGIAFDFIVKLPIIIADALIASVIYSVLKAYPRSVRFGWSMAYALNPLAIMVSAAHGQFDALVVLGMLLAWVWLPEHPRRSALALGIAITFKLYPILLIPPFLLWFDLKQNRRGFLRWLLWVSVPLGIVVLPFLLRGQWDALLRPLQYGLIGTTYLGILTFLSNLGVPIRGITPNLSQSGLETQILSRGRLSILFRIALAGGVLALCARARRNLRRIDALPLALLLLVYLLSGLAVQYLIWVLPFGLLRRDRFALLYTLVASFLAAALYLTISPAIFAGRGSTALIVDPAIVGWLNGIFYILVFCWFIRLIRSSD